MTGDVPLGKACTGVCEKVVPLAFERVVISSIPQSGVIFGDHVLHKVSVEPSTPLAEGTGIV